jgi:predicted alpha/beta superfamily hydrolase
MGGQGIVLDIFSINATSFQEARQIRVFLPKDYLQQNIKYPVLYMHDGQNVFQDEIAVGGVSLGLEDYLNENELEVIVVGIDQNSKERLNEYCPWKDGEYSEKILGYKSSTGGKGKQYIDFIVHELKPHIDSKYRTIIDRTAISGISLGGLISTYAACMYPHIFKHVAVLSSAFWRNQEEIEKLLKESDISGLESFYLDCGDKEGKGEFINKEFLASNTAISKILAEKLPNTKFEVIHKAEHHYQYFRERVPQLFRFLQTTSIAKNV